MYASGHSVAWRRRIAPGRSYVRKRTLCYDLRNSRCAAMNRKRQDVVNRKGAELDHANSDLQNLLNSTQVATIFLDSGLRIRNFTPAAGALFRLVAGDAGRPLTDLAAQFAGEGRLVEDMKEVLRTLTVREREMTGAQGRHFLMRM